MKKHLAGLLAIALLSLCVALVACQKDEPVAPPPTPAPTTAPVAPPAAPPTAAVVTIPPLIIMETEKEITADNATAMADQLDQELDQELAEE